MARFGRMVSLFLKKFEFTNNSLAPFASKPSRIPADNYETNLRFAAVVKPVMSALHAGCFRPGT